MIINGLNILNEYHKNNYFMVLSELVNNERDGKSFKIQKDGKKYIFRYRFRYLDLEDSGEMIMDEDLDLLLKKIKLKYKEKILDFYKYLLKSVNQENNKKYEIFGIKILEYFFDNKLSNINSNDYRKLCNNINCCDIQYITPYHKHLCKFCEEKIEDNDFDKHLYSCSMRNIRCNDCFWNGKFCEFQAHLCINGSNKENFSHL